MPDDDSKSRCPQCLHWWVSHGVPAEDDYGCAIIESSMAERDAMSKHARELERQGVPAEVAGPQAYRELRYCGCKYREGNAVTPRQVRIWSDGTSDPTPPWAR